ncbi:MAG: hypothetical protein NZ955_00580 [Candidatus Bathyarchaeota archaeon]|nr:hypothetical protein [Candidatus Bathyarchaeota archaeon]MCX8161546.1 hypothetical protein [Candidatus Bathyarchaeota archaeon]
MVVRVKVKISRNCRVLESTALANAGYEAETPQILIPTRVAQLLDLWPPREGMEETEFETAGGPLMVWIASRSCKVRVFADDVESSEVEADAVVSTLADEILLSDKMISELEIALEDVGRGLWRFRWEPKEKTRRSEPPRYWR